MLRWRGWPVLAGVWAGLFAALHFYWALGGSRGLASSAGAELAGERPTWFVVGGLWGVGMVLLAACGLAVALAGARSTGLPRRLLLLAGGTVGLVLLTRAVGVEVLLLGGALDANAAIRPDQRYWTLVFWNPWFAVGGLVFALASVAMARRPPQ